MKTKQAAESVNGAPSQDFSSMAWAGEGVGLDDERWPETRSGDAAWPPLESSADPGRAVADGMDGDAWDWDETAPAGETRLAGRTPDDWEFSEPEGQDWLDAEREARWMLGIGGEAPER